MSPLGLLWRLPEVVYYGESIFEFEYLREYGAKIENIYTLVCGPQDVSLSTVQETKKIGFLIDRPDLQAEQQEVFKVKKLHVILSL